jgi:adenylate cyclase
MASEPARRRLSAILAADVAGYSRLIGEDEEGTLAALRALRGDLIDPRIAEHRGRIVKTTGDGLLAEFRSVVDAVRCAAAWQAAMPEDGAIRFRIGIHQGDIVVENDDIFGDGVNIAARLESIADPGGICVSARVQEDAAGRLDLEFEDLGEQQLKNIARPIRAFRVIGPRASRPQTTENAGETAAVQPLPLPDKPSIAVLPFENMSGDPEQEYFADGMVEDIITALSRNQWLFVIARNSSFTYKGRAVDVKQVGRELGVRYVLEGSVRRGGARVRITGQLIDAATGAHIWADRFEGMLDDVFELQDQVTASVVGAIAPKLEQAEMQRAKHKPTGSLDAYDNYLRGASGLHAVFEGDREAVSEALRRFHRAIELDPDYAAAYGMVAWCHVLRRNYGWALDDPGEAGKLERAARQAARLAKEDTIALYAGGFALTHIPGQLDAGIALIDRALTRDPNLAAAWHLSGWARIYRGEAEAAIAHMAQAMRLNPLDPLIFGMLNGTALAHFLAGRYDEAAHWAETAFKRHPGYSPAARAAAASHALAGRLDTAREFLALMRQVDPDLRLADLKMFSPYRRPEDSARYGEGLRLAGVPE